MEKNTYFMMKPNILCFLPFIDEMKLTVMRGDRLQETLLKWFPWALTAVQHHLLIAIVGNAPVVFLIMDMLLAAHSSWCCPNFPGEAAVFLARIQFGNEHRPFSKGNMIMIC
jgi:hypothetical protein